MYRTIREVKHILDKHKIKFWPDCGTLLFMYRDSKLDPSDVDLSIMFDDKDKLMGAIEEFVIKGFGIQQIYAHKDRITEVSFRKNGLAVDIFLRQKKGNYLVGYSNYGHTISWGQPIHYFQFKKFEFDGIKYNIPKDTEGYLKYYFGLDWKTPRQNWDSSKDAPCINRRWL